MSVSEQTESRPSQGLANRWGRLHPLLKTMIIGGGLLGVGLVVGDQLVYSQYSASPAECQDTMPLIPRWEKSGLDALERHHLSLEATEPIKPPGGSFRILDRTMGRHYKWSYADPNHYGDATAKFWVSTRWTFYPTNWTWLHHAWELQYNCAT